MKLVVKIGGSLAISEDGPRTEYFRKLLPVLKRLAAGHQLIVSIGGGAFIRKYYDSIRKLRLKNEEIEWIAIELLRVNVRFLAFLLGKKPIYTLEEISAGTSGVIGGIVPGRSTDANAAYAAAKIKADYFIKLTDVDGVYDRDPRKNKAAKKLGFIPFGRLRAYATKGKPGSYGVIDALAIDTITRHKIRTIVMSGKNPKDIFKALRGEKTGTLIA